MSHRWDSRATGLLLHYKWTQQMMHPSYSAYHSNQGMLIVTVPTSSLSFVFFHSNFQVSAAWRLVKVNSFDNKCQIPYLNQWKVVASMYHVYSFCCQGFANLLITDLISRPCGEWIPRQCAPGAIFDAVLQICVPQNLIQQNPYGCPSGSVPVSQCGQESFSCPGRSQCTEVSVGLKQWSLIYI